VPTLGAGSELTGVDGDGWVLHDAAGHVVRRYAAEQVRFSVSWKAYCFADETARDQWREHRDDLGYDEIVARLVDDLRARGRINGSPPEGGKLGLALIDEYVRFPTEDRRPT
jgi:hypothetical protein